MLKFLSILCMAVMATSSVAQEKPGIVGKNPTARTSPALKGDEILVEVETNNVSGLYALDWNRDNQTPLLLAPNAHSPHWAPEHKIFSFVRSGHVWIQDLSGNQRQVATIPPYARENFSMGWDNAGRPYALFNVPGWGSIFARGVGLDESLAESRLQNGEPLNLKFTEEIILRDKDSSASMIDRFVVVPEASNTNGTKIPLLPNVKSVTSVAFSPDNRYFTTAVIDALPQNIKGQSSEMWLFESIDSNSKKQGFSIEEYNEKIRNNDYSIFYIRNGLYPNASFKAKLTKKSDAYDFNPLWSPDGTMIAFSRLNVADEEIWPQILSGADFNSAIPVRIDGYFPYPKSQWGRKFVQPLFWGEEGDLFLIEGAQNRIYRAVKKDGAFEAKVVLEIQGSGQPTFQFPARKSDWISYVFSGDRTPAVRLKNFKSQEELRIDIVLNGQAQGVIKSLSW